MGVARLRQFSLSSQGARRRLWDAARDVPPRERVARGVRERVHEEFDPGGLQQVGSEHYAEGGGGGGKEVIFFSCRGPPRECKGSPGHIRRD